MSFLVQSPHDQGNLILLFASTYPEYIVPPHVSALGIFEHKLPRERSLMYSVLSHSPISLSLQQVSINALIFLTTYLESRSDTSRVNLLNVRALMSVADIFKLISLSATFLSSDV